MVPAEPNKKAWMRAFVNAFILLHLFIMIIWGMPRSAFRSTVAKPVETYVVQSGLWHSWDMFAPNPLSMNFNLVAEITYRDRTTREWEFPRMEKLGQFEKVREERWRKLRERVRQDSYRVVWPDVCRHLARVHNNPTNPPMQVALIRHWAKIPPPQSGDYQPIPPSYEMTNSYRFITYQVKENDL